MINIPMKSAAPMTKRTIMTINQQRVQTPKSSRDIKSLNNGIGQNTGTSFPVHTGTASLTASSQSNSSVSNAATALRTEYRPVPSLLHPLQKGQKVSLTASGQISVIKACLGWNTTNPDCDIDVSAFMLNSGGKVIGEDWFVFYGQTKSPDNSTMFQLETAGPDRESITIDLSKVNASVKKIVFVLTINEAAEKHLNFSMLKDAYIRIFDKLSNCELASFKMDEYYSNVTSMMIGEVYQHNGVWKFNAIGNGVARDLAGLCELYGVQVI